jgi:ATP-dependent helicase HrpA
MNFCLVDEAGKELAMSRNLFALQQEWASKAQRSFRGWDNSELTREGISQWDFGGLPEQVDLERHGLKLKGYPGLQDKGDSVSLVIMDSAETAREITRLGLRRLFILALSGQINHLRKNLPGIQGMCLHYIRILPAPWGKDAPSRPSCENLKDELIQGIVDRAFILNCPLVHSAEEFATRKEKGCGNLMITANEFCHLVGDILAEYHQIAKQLSGNLPLAWLHSINDIREQLTYLVYHGFINHTPPTWLSHLPRYLKAIGLRLSKLAENPGRDKQRQAEITPLWLACRQRLETHQHGSKINPALETYRWMLEEYRVSLFAQELGTAYPVSSKRLEAQWKEV